MCMILFVSNKKTNVRHRKTNEKKCLFKRRICKNLSVRNLFVQTMIVLGRKGN